MKSWTTLGFAVIATGAIACQSPQQQPSDGGGDAAYGRVGPVDAAAGRGAHATSSGDASVEEAGASLEEDETVSVDFDTDTDPAHDVFVDEEDTADDLPDDPDETVTATDMTSNEVRAYEWDDESNSVTLRNGAQSVRISVSPQGQLQLNGAPYTQEGLSTALQQAGLISNPQGRFAMLALLQRMHPTSASERSTVIALPSPLSVTRNIEALECLDLFPPTGINPGVGACNDPHWNIQTDIAIRCRTCINGGGEVDATAPGICAKLYRDYFPERDSVGNERSSLNAWSERTKFMCYLQGWRFPGYSPPAIPPPTPPPSGEPRGG